MGLSTGQKRALVIGMAAPVVYVFLLLAASMITSALASGLSKPGMTPATYVFFALIWLFPFVLLEMLALTVVFVVLAVRAFNAEPKASILWVFAVVLFGLLGQMAFYSTVISPRERKPLHDMPDSFDNWN